MPKISRHLLRASSEPALRFLPGHSRLSTMTQPPSPIIHLNDPSLLPHSSFISNSLVPPRNNDTHISIYNPANHNLVSQIASATPSVLANALSAATTAFKTWRHTSPKYRSKILRLWHDLMLSHKEDLAHLITLENGKPLSEALAEVHYAASFIDWNAHSVLRGHNNSSVIRRSRDEMAMVIREPIGVCVLITPWNFPLAMLTRKAAAAIAAGCTTVAKPSELTPLSAVAAAILAERAGLDDGVLNVVVSENGKESVDRLLEGGGVRMVSFTGSTRVGKLVAAKASERVLKCCLELGGNAVAIVMQDAVIGDAVEGVVMGKIRAGGQSCVAVNRIFVEKDVYGRFVEELVERVRRLKIGNGLEEGVDYGPLISMESVKRVEAMVEEAVEKGAKVVYTGEGVKKVGHFFPVCVVVGVTDEMRLGREEVFGPVFSVMEFEGVEEVLRKAAIGGMGLAGYVWGRDLGRVNRVIEGLEVGMVGVNTVGISDAGTLFGGVRESGIGREGGASDEFTEAKYVLMKS